MTEEPASPYVDIARLGRGGMREVFLSLRRDLIARDGLVVVKRVDPWLAEEPDFVEHYVVEAETAMRLDHPGVVRMKKVGRDDAGHYVAMEYVDGQSLLALLRRAAATNGVPLAMHLRVLADALEPLHYAHELDVLHRDATARNVFIDYEGRVRLADFCIGRSNESRQTAADVLRTQKVPYMSPEEARGDELDRRSDVFAFGVMIWKAATGQRLWRGLTGMQTLYRLHKGDIPSPRTVDPNVPERLETICMRALARDRADRYATAKELRDDLETFLREAGEPVTARDVGKRVSDLFSEARAKNDHIIDAQIAAVKANRSAPPEVKDLRLDAGDTAETTPENTDDSRFWATGMMAPSPSIAPRAIEPARPVARPPARAAAAESPVAGSLPQWAIYALGILALAIAATLLLRR